MPDATRPGDVRSSAAESAAARPVPFRGGGFAPRRVLYVGPVVFIVLIALIEIGTQTGVISNLVLPSPSACSGPSSSSIRAACFGSTCCRRWSD